MRDYDCVWLSVVKMHQRRKRNRVSQQKSDGPQVKKKNKKEAGFLKYLKNRPSFKAMGLGKRSTHHGKQKSVNQENTQSTPVEENVNMLELDSGNQIMSQCLENKIDSEELLQSTVDSMDMNYSSNAEEVDVHFSKVGIFISEEISENVHVKEMLVGSSSTESSGKVDILSEAKSGSLSEQEVSEGSGERASCDSGINGADHEERSLSMRGIGTSKTPEVSVKKSDEIDLTCSYDVKETSETVISCNLKARLLEDNESASERNIFSQGDVSCVSDDVCDGEISLPALDIVYNEQSKSVRNRSLIDYEEMGVTDPKELYNKEHLRFILQTAGVLEKDNLVACPLLPVSNELVFAAINCGLFSHDNIYSWLCKAFKKKKSSCTKISLTQYGWFKELYDYISSSDQKVEWETILQNTLYSPPKCSELCLIFNSSDFLKDDVIDFYRHVHVKKDPSVSNRFDSHMKPAEIGETSEVGKVATLVKIVQASYDIGDSGKNKSNFDTSLKVEKGKVELGNQETNKAECKTASGDQQYHSLVEELKGAIKNVRLLTSLGKVSSARNEKQKSELDEGEGNDEKKKSSDRERGGKYIKHFDSVLLNLYLLMTGKRSSVENFKEILKELYWNLRQVESTVYYQRKEVERKQAKINATEVENKQLVKNNEELGKNLEKSKFEVKTKCIHNQQLKKLIKEANDKIGARDLIIRQLESKRKLMKTKLRNLEQHVNYLRSECKSKDLQCKEMMIKCDEAAFREEQTKKREVEMLAQINHQTHLLNQSDNAAKLKDSITSAMCLELKSLQEEAKTLTSDNMKYEGMTKDLESLLEQKNSTVANILHKLSEKDKANEMLTSQVSLRRESERDLLVEKERLSSHLQELEERLVRCCSIMSDNEKTIKHLKDVIMEFEDEAKRKAEHIVQLNEIILNLESGIKDKNSLIEQIQQEALYFSHVLKDQYEQFKAWNGPQHNMASQTTALSCVMNDPIGNGCTLLNKDYYCHDCFSELVVVLKNRKDELRELTSALRELEIKFRKNLEFVGAAQDPLNFSTLVEDVTMLIFTTMETSEKICSFLGCRKTMRTDVNKETEKPTNDIQSSVKTQELKVTQPLSSNEKSKPLGVLVKPFVNYNTTCANEEDVACNDIQVPNSQEPKHLIKGLLQGQSLGLIFRTKNKVTRENKEQCKKLFSSRDKKGNVFERRNFHTNNFSKDPCLESKVHISSSKNRSPKDVRSRDKNSDISSMTKEASRGSISRSKKLSMERTKSFTSDRKGIGKERIMEKGTSSSLDTVSDMPTEEISCVWDELCDSSSKKQSGKKQKQADIENKSSLWSKHSILSGNQRWENGFRLSEHPRKPSITDFEAKSMSPSLERRKDKSFEIYKDVATADFDGKSLGFTHQQIIRQEDVISVLSEDQSQVGGVHIYRCLEKNYAPIKKLKIAKDLCVLHTCGTEKFPSEDLCMANDSSPFKITKHEEPAKHQECQNNSDGSFVQDRFMVNTVCSFTEIERIGSSFHITGSEDQEIRGLDPKQDLEAERIRLDIMQSCGHVVKHLQSEMDKVTGYSKNSVTDCNLAQEQATSVGQEISQLYESICSDSDEISEAAFRTFDEQSLLSDVGMKCQDFESQCHDATEKEVRVDLKGKCYSAQPVPCGRKLTSLGDELHAKKCNTLNLDTSSYKQTAGSAGIKLSLEKTNDTKNIDMKTREKRDKKWITIGGRADRGDALKQNNKVERCGGNRVSSKAPEDISVEARKDKQHLESREENAMIFEWLENQTIDIEPGIPVASGKKRKIDCELEEKHSMLERKGSKRQLSGKISIQDDRRASKQKKVSAIENWHESLLGCRGVETHLKGGREDVQLEREKDEKKNESKDRNAGRETVQENTGRIKVVDERKSNGCEKEVKDSERGDVRTVTSVHSASSQTKSKLVTAQARALNERISLQERNIRRGIILARMCLKIASLEKQQQNADEHLNILEKDNDSLVILLQEKNAALQKAVQENKDIKVALNSKEHALEVCLSNSIKRKALISNLEKDKLSLLEEKKNVKKELEKCAVEIKALKETFINKEKCLSQKIDIIDQQGSYIGNLLSEKVESEKAWKAEREDAERVHGKEMKLISERLSENESLVGEMLIDKARMEGLLEARTKAANEMEHLLTEKEKCIRKAVNERLLLERSLKASMAVYNHQKAVITEREKCILELQKEKIEYETLSRILAEQLHGKECTATENEDQKELSQKSLRSSDQGISGYSSVAKYSEKETEKEKFTVSQKDLMNVLIKEEDQLVLIEDVYPSVDVMTLPMATDSTSKIKHGFCDKEMNMQNDGIFDKENIATVLLEERKMAAVLEEELWNLKRSFIHIHSKIMAIQKEFTSCYEDDIKEYRTIIDDEDDIKECKTEKKTGGDDEEQGSHPNPTPGNANDQVLENSEPSEGDSDDHNRICGYKTGAPDMGKLFQEVDMEIDCFVVIKARNMRLEKRLLTSIKENKVLGEMIEVLANEKIEVDKTINHLLAEKEDLSSKLMEKEDELSKARESHSGMQKVLDEERKNSEDLLDKNKELLHEADKQQQVIDGYLAELKECRIEMGKKETILVDLQKKSECIKGLKSQIKNLKKDLEKGNKDTYETRKVIDSLLQEQEDLKDKLQVADSQLKAEKNEHCCTKNKFTCESNKLRESIEEKQQLTQDLLSKERLLTELSESMQTEKKKLLKNASELESLNLKLLKDEEQWQMKLKLCEKKYHLLLRDKSAVFRSEVNILNEQFSSLKEFNSWVMDQHNYLAESRLRLRKALSLEAPKNIQSIPTSQEIEEVQRICSALQQKEGEVDALKVLLREEAVKRKKLVEILQEEQSKSEGATKNFQEYQNRILAAEESAREALNSKEALQVELQEEQMKNTITEMLLLEKNNKTEHADRRLQEQQAKIDAYEVLLEEGQRESKALRIALQEEQLRMENVSFALLGEQVQGADAIKKHNTWNVNIDYEADAGFIRHKDQACQTEASGEDYANYEAQIAQLQYDWNLEKMASRHFCAKLIEEHVEAKEHLEFELELMKIVVDRQLKRKGRLRHLLACNADNADV